MEILKCDPENFYVSIEEAREEIKKRWNNIILKEEVERYLKKDVPHFFLNEPRGVLFRDILIIDTEFERSFELARRTGVKFLGFEFLNDKFCTRNADKLRLGRIDIFDKYNKNREVLCKSEKIFNFPQNDNKKFLDIYTFWGQKLVDFYHQIIAEDSRVIDFVDMSEWFKRNGEMATNYYEKYFALFVCHGILFENFMFESEESDFTKSIVSPAFRKVVDFFGVKPLIVEIFSKEEINEADQWYYRVEMKNRIEAVKRKFQSNLIK